MNSRGCLIKSRQPPYFSSFQIAKSQNMNLMNKCFIIIFIALGFFNPVFAQIKIDFSKLQINKIDKMNLIGLGRNLVSASNSTLFCYHDVSGQFESETYLDKNNLDLLVDKQGRLVVIYLKGFKKNLTYGRASYSAIQIDYKAKTGEKLKIIEDDRMDLRPVQSITTFILNNDPSSREIIQININPPFYYYYVINRISRADLSSSKYSFSMEFVIPDSFRELYDFILPRFKTQTFLDSLQSQMDFTLNYEIEKLPSQSPKGEFETTDQYNARISAGQDEIAALKKKYAEIGDYIKSRYIDDKIQRIRDSYQQIVIKIGSMGAYDADNQIFPITINGETQNIKVPLESAKQFKEKKDEIVVTADKQLDETGNTFQLFNIKMKHPLTGEIINFGVQREPLFIK